MTVRPSQERFRRRANRFMWVTSRPRKYPCPGRAGASENRDGRGISARCLGSLRRRGRGGYTSVNLTPVAFMRSRAVLISSETMKAPVQPSGLSTLASPTFVLSMRKSRTEA